MKQGNKPAPKPAKYQDAAAEISFKGMYYIKLDHSTIIVVQMKVHDFVLEEYYCR